MFIITCRHKLITSH